MFTPTNPQPVNQDEELRQALRELDPRDFKDVLHFARFLSWRQGKRSFDATVARGAWLYFRFKVFGKA